MNTSKIVKSLKIASIGSLFTAAVIFGVAALDSDVRAQTIDIMDTPVPAVEVVGHAAGLSGIAGYQIARAIERRSGGQTDEPDDPTLS